MELTGIKVNNFSKEDIITKLQSAISELPDTNKRYDRINCYMNKAILYFEDVIPILEKSGNKNDKIKAKHCYTAIPSLRRMIGIF